MRDVSIIGIGMIPVAEHWGRSLRMLAAEAAALALNTSDITRPDALYVGNAYGSSLSSQSHLGALIADYIGLSGIEAYTVEAGDASGGAALRTGYLAVASGAIDYALVLGVEKSTDTVGTAHTRARNISLDADYEAAHGATLPALAALLMRRYMHEHKLDLSVFEGFSINAHNNGKQSNYAMFRNTLKPGAFAKAPMLSDPVSLFDHAPDADGAAAILLAPASKAQNLSYKPVAITGSAVATDKLMLQDRQDMLFFKAAQLSAQKACNQAAITHKDIDLFELHDSFTIVSTLTLEATGFARRGEGWKLGSDDGNQISRSGKLPISTFGGLKSRGNPAGATGIYQTVEACLQLQRQADNNQVPNAQTAMIQNLGGLGSTAVTHILQV